jgi:predicted metal-binding protein
MLECKGCHPATHKLSGEHTYDDLAQMLESIYNEFEITDKISLNVNKQLVSCTTTIAILVQSTSKSI